MSTTFSRTSEGPFLIVILGPTASGKSRIAIELAKELGSSVINADSRQFYREMRIGTDRPTEEEQDGVPHYFLGDRSVTEHLSAGDLEKEALPLLQKMIEKGETPVLVGGSGFYIDALCHGLDPDLPSPDPKVREELERLHQEEGLDSLLEELKEKDPVHFERMDRQNPRRVIRALEVCRISGRPFSSFHGRGKKERPFTPLKIGIRPEKEELQRRIEERVERMFEKGLLEEAKGLLPYREEKALQTLGYRELFSYFDGELSLEEAKERIVTNTRRYAKRQMTWFKKDKEVRWSSPDEKDELLRTLKEKLDKSGP